MCSGIEAELISKWLESNKVKVCKPSDNKDLDLWVWDND